METRAENRATSLVNSITVWSTQFVTQTVWYEFVRGWLVARFCPSRVCWSTDLVRWSRLLSPLPRPRIVPHLTWLPIQQRVCCWWRRGQPPPSLLLFSPTTPSTSTWVALEPCPMQQSMCWSCQSHERHPRDPCAAPPPRSAEREVTSESSFYGCRSMQRRRKQQLHLWPPATVPYL